MTSTKRFARRRARRVRTSPEESIDAPPSDDGKVHFGVHNHMSTNSGTQPPPSNPGLVHNINAISDAWGELDEEVLEEGYADTYGHNQKGNRAAVAVVNGCVSGQQLNGTREEVNENFLRKESNYRAERKRTATNFEQDDELDGDHVVRVIEHVRKVGTCPESTAVSNEETIIEIGSAANEELEGNCETYSIWERGNTRDEVIPVVKQEKSLKKKDEPLIDTDEIVVVSQTRAGAKNEMVVAKFENGIKGEPVMNLDRVSGNDGKLKELRGVVMNQRNLVKDLHRLLNEATTNLNNLEKQMADRVIELRRAADAAFDWNGNSFPWDSVLATSLRDVFRINSFRPLQREALNATLLKRNVFAIMPTGAGKSLIYQLAGVLDQGLTVVVTPLISLSVDQKRSLRNLFIYAESLDSTSSKDAVKHIFTKVLPKKGSVQSSSQPRKKRRRVEKKKKNNEIKKQQGWVRDDMETTILFVTPEQLVRNKKLMSRIEMMNEAGHLSRIVIDEAHCCSSWGHDFRPDYTKLGILKRQCPDVPILALSATSCPETTTDVCKILEIPNCVIFRGSIDRSNLFYEVRPKPDDEQEVIVDIASMLLNEFKGQCGIIYVLSRKEAETYSNDFKELGIRSGCYHGDMTREERGKVHEGWQNGGLQVAVATIAFGMGIDNLRVRFVIHATMATSIEGYYQESGRAGRNGSPAKCIVLHRAKDFARLSSFVAEKGEARVRKMYEMYRYATGRGVEEVGDQTAMCRRALIARAFGETPPNRTDEERRLCCDICARQSGIGRTVCGVVLKDVTELAKAVLRIMVNQTWKRPDEKMTILMLASNWSNTGDKGKRMRGDEPAINRKISVEARIEIIIGLVFVGGLQEFHRHSSYAVNAYVTTGPNVDEVLEGNVPVTAVLRVKDARIVDGLRRNPDMIVEE